MKIAFAKFFPFYNLCASDPLLMTRLNREGEIGRDRKRL